ncbi:uncharacterized protein LOC120575282 [Perca fluviatilis]|uniref:uncharacterized protein LOC120575282 n=1 Tax=Perca fluviatilis TaxID=8168 RepID=UPI0019669029|nr:uncharacterized protein LOC120575282 [Perca fluviatilis]
MISPLIICTVCLLCTAGVGCTKVVQQTPGLLVQRGQSAQMDCSHTLPGAFYNMYWFQQLPGKSMELIVHTVPYKKPDFGNFSQDKYSANKTVIESGSFTVKNVKPDDNGVYLCGVTVTEIAAVRVHGAPPTPQSSVRRRKMEAEIRIRRVGEGEPTQAKRRLNKEISLWFNCTKTGGWYVFFPLCLCSSSLVVYDIKGARCAYYEPRFGPGTKLTVLDSNRTITPPKVKVLQPSPNECQTNKDKKHKKTLVCVASHFYPDHVSVFWQINGVNVTRGVATDNAALWGGEHYSISSRLTVPLSDWLTPSKTFTCTVSFFNGTDTVPRSDWVRGVEVPAAPTRGKYLRITHTAKLFYATLIAKSSVFGVFVAFLVWRLQGSSGKQKD